MMAPATSAGSRPRATIRLRRALLHQDGGGHQVGRGAQAADREVLERARRLDAVVGIRGDGLARPAGPARCERPCLDRNLSIDRNLQSAIYNSPMIPAFFDSVLDLIVKTSTELPPDVRAAMADCHGQRAGGHPVGAGPEDHRDQHRPGGQQRGRDLPGHRHAHLRDQDAGRRQPDLDQAADSSGGGRGHHGAASCAPTRSTRSPAPTRATTSGPARRSCTSSSGRTTTRSR